MRNKGEEKREVMGLWWLEAKRSFGHNHALLTYSAYQHTFDRPNYHLGAGGFGNRRESAARGQFGGVNKSIIQI
jgi:hypothetical protein